MALLFRRFVVVQLLLLWQGGFLFYAACVVPAGTQALGSAAVQGTVTARVTDALNLIGLAGVVVFALELSLTRDPSTRRTACRWWTWGVAMLCQFLLLYLHVLLDAFMDPGRKRVVIGVAFYPVHAAYLWTSAVQWLACLLLTWWTLKAWREEDRKQD